MEKEDKIINCDHVDGLFAYNSNYEPTCTRCKQTLTMHQVKMVAQKRLFRCVQELKKKDKIQVRYE